MANNEIKSTNDSPVIDIKLIPPHVAQDIAMTVLRGYRRSIREEPERRQHYRQLGMAFLERRAQQRKDEEVNAHDETGRDGGAA